jgi:hypothetical protein
MLHGEGKKRAPLIGSSKRELISQRRALIMHKKKHDLLLHRVMSMNNGLDPRPGVGAALKRHPWARVIRNCGRK